MVVNSDQWWLMMVMLVYVNSKLNSSILGDFQ